MRFLFGGRVLLAALLAAVFAALTALPAGATVPGTNGQIAFVRGGDVFTANPDGTQVDQVPLVYPTDELSVVVWSTDGSKLLISHTFRLDSAGECCLPFRPAIVSPTGAGYTLLTMAYAPFDMDCQAWSVDQTRIFCGFGGDEPGVFSVRASDGGDPVRLTTNPYGGQDVATDASPDGTRFVFLRSQQRSVGRDRTQQVALFVENVDGTGLRQITPYGLSTAHDVFSAHWSPDGQEIIFSSTDGRLYTVHPDGTGLTPIKLQTGTGRYFAFEPDWSPDGTKIAFCMGINGQEDIYTANADGSDVAQVTNTPDFENGPDWGTHSLAG
jgi:Tol biopolymer transport system component